MKRWQDKLRKIDPYIPGEQSDAPNLIKLNANENPYPPSPRVQKVLSEACADQLRFYPDTNGRNLRSALARRFGLKPEQVFLGNGSDDVLALAFQAFFASNQPILFPDITYSFYPVWCDLLRIPFERVALRDDFTLDPRAFDRPNGGVIFPNPNAPTSLSAECSVIEDILQHNQDCIVIIDEAYVDFSTFSCVSLLEKYENLVIVQTMSKSRSLAGLRIGYALCSPELAAVLESVKNSYNSYPMDTIALACGTASVEDEEYFRETCAKIIATREHSTQALQALGFTVLPSQTNFLFAKHKSQRAEAIFNALKSENIFVRYFRIPEIDNYLRITVGTDDEMARLLHALQHIL
ncbi:MAG: histidinol-phosphate transaminase [Clostridiaceae bacterium]|nr:histidinol-phosphate transaminase [Clostridiaceae bacterium]